ncbi:MAG: DUF2254 family protein [Candidatus Rokuibacteriota bacterium]
MNSIAVGGLLLGLVAVRGLLRQRFGGGWGRSCRRPPVRRASSADSDFFDAVRRAFAEFLTVPTLIIAGFVLLAASVYALERADLTWLSPLHAGLRSFVFGSPQATSDLLSTIAAGLITVTSITISRLRVALQQSAGSMISEVFDRRSPIPIRSTRGPAQQRSQRVAPTGSGRTPKGEGAVSIPSPPEGERVRVRGRARRGTCIRE